MTNEYHLCYAYCLLWALSFYTSSPGLHWNGNNCIIIKFDKYWLRAIEKIINFIGNDGDNKRRKSLIYLKNLYESREQELLCRFG